MKITPFLFLTLTGCASLPVTPQGQRNFSDEIVGGELEAGDSAPLPAGNARADATFFRDTYSIQSSGEQVVTATLTADFDGYLLLLDAGGNVIAENDDDPSDEKRSRIDDADLASAESYRLIVTSFRAGASGEYALRIDGPDRGPQPSEDAELTAGTLTAGELRSRDHARLSRSIGRSGTAFFRDGYTFDGRAGQQVTLDAHSDFDAYLILLGPDDAVLAENDDDVTMYASRIESTLAADGPHRVIVTSFGKGRTGDYTLQLRSGPVTPR